MKEVKIHHDEYGHPIDLYVDGKTHPLVAYILLAAIPAEPPATVILTYGSSDLIGRALMTFYERCIVEQPEMAWVIEQVARGIIGLAEAVKGSAWPGEGTGPGIVQ